MPDHPGFEYWPGNAADFPIGDITLKWSDELSACVAADITIPNAQPSPATVAEASIGIAHSCQFWFALRCTTQPNGRVACEGVLTGRHVHWFPAHNEDGPGPEQQLRLSAAELAGGGRKEALAAHGPHCNLFSVTWYQVGGAVRCELSINHFHSTPEQFLKNRKRNAEEAERKPPRLRIVIPPLVDPESPPKPPPPAPQPIGFLDRLKRAWKVLVGRV